MGMGGFDVVVLRGICEAHADRHIMPLLRELQAQQGELLDKLKSIEEVKPMEERCAALQDRIALKADLDMVPSMAQFEELCAKFDQLGTRGVDTELEARLTKRLDELEAAIQQKADMEDIVSADQLEELSALVSQKANHCDVVTSEQLKRLAATVDRKANTNKVPSLQQWQELEKAVAAKVDSKLCPTLAQVEELAEEVKRKKISSQAQEEVRKVAAELQIKANTSDVLSAAQVERLVKDKVETMMARKADVTEVPSLSQHKELAAATERKLSFLATKVNQKSEAIREMCQQPQTVWCMQPAVLDVSWDESGQAWREWNPSQIMPCSGGDSNGYPGNVFVPHQMFVGPTQCAVHPVHRDGPDDNGPAKSGNLHRVHSDSTSAASSTAPTPPSQEAAQET